MHEEFIRISSANSSQATRTFVTSIALSAAIALPASKAAAEGVDEIATDRPDFVKSSSVVGKGLFQVETTVSHERDCSERVKSRIRSAPTLLLYGATEDLDVRIETEGLVRQVVASSGATTTDTGAADASLGATLRIRAANEASGQAALAVIATIDLDSGSSAFRGAGKVPVLRLVAEWDLPGDASIRLMPGLFYGKDEASRSCYWGGILAATYSRPIARSTRGFIEIAGQELRSKRYGGNVVTFDTGVTYLIDNDTQIDFSINLGLNRNSPDRTLAIGLSRRFR